MNNPIQLTKTIPLVTTSNSPSPLRRGFLFTALSLALVYIALAPSPNAFGVSPAPDGGYPNGNTAEGDNALFSLTTGQNNTATGLDALFSNTTGDFNVANGATALQSNTTGTGNTANGVSALQNNTIGNFNTANGVNAILKNTTGGNNTANGVSALFHNTTGSNNTANGVNALVHNTIGNFNTANGQGSLLSNTTGSNSMADGQNALENNSTGSNNIALGSNAGINLTTGSNNIDIGNVGKAGESNVIRIGTKGTQTATFIAGISGKTVATGVGVFINSNGQLGTVQSSARFKDDIKPMDKVSEALLKLKPVTFRYKHEFDPDGIPQFGLVAEQVEKVNPALVARDEKGKAYTVRYEAVNAMLLNEFLKEHRKVEEQVATIADVKATVAKQEAVVAQQQKDFQSTVAQQQKAITALTAALKAQAAQIQKVSDQLEARPLAPRLAANEDK